MLLKALIVLPILSFTCAEAWLVRVPLTCRAIDGGWAGALSFSTTELCQHKTINEDLSSSVEPHQFLYEAASLLDNLENAGGDRSSQVASEAFRLVASAWHDNSDTETPEWEHITNAMEEASNLLSSMPSSPTTNLYRQISFELKDASSIEGCMSVGPPSSIPNWAAIQALFGEFAAINNDHEDGIADIYRAIEKCIEDLIEAL